MSGHDHHGDVAAHRCPACVETWWSARTVDDLGALGARWLTGELELQPRYFGAAPDPETVPLVQTLAAVNLAGFWTHMSQPGLVDGELRQRAYVAGYCRPEVAERLEVLGLTDLVVLACAAEVPGSFDVPITVQGYEPHTWGARGGESPEEFAGELHPTAVAALWESVHVEVLDPMWGRDDLLWDLLLEAVAD